MPFLAAKNKRTVWILACPKREYHMRPTLGRASWLALSLLECSCASKASCSRVNGRPKREAAVGDEPDDLGPETLANALSR